MKFIFALLAMLSFALHAETINLTDQNTMSLNGPVDGTSMTSLMSQLSKLNDIQTTEPIFLVMNSPGGSIYDGFDFIRYAQTSKRQIHTITIFAASMGFQIVEALGTRYVTSYSTLMSHKARGSLGSLEFPGQLDSRYAHILSHLNEQDKSVVARTKGKQTLESYANLIQNEYWANSTKAITDGFADAEVTVACDKSLAGTREEIINMGFFAISATFSNCPLITQPLSLTLARGFDYVNENKIDIYTEYNKLFNAKNAKY